MNETRTNPCSRITCCCSPPTIATPSFLLVDKAFTLLDENGTKYLDLLSGIGVNALGYGHPAIEEAIARQSRALIHTSNLFYHEGQAELALRLTEWTGLDRAFFANTGTEAWEGALKLARAHAGLLRSEGKTGWHKVSRARTEFSRPNLWLHVDHLQSKIPRSIRPCSTRAWSLSGSMTWPICARNSPMRSARFSSRPYRAKAAFDRSRRNFSLRRVRLPLLPARC